MIAAMIFVVVVDGRGEKWECGNGWVWE